MDLTSWRVWLVAMLTCLTMTASQFMYKFSRLSSRSRCTSSCAQSQIFWPPACFTTASQCSTPVPDLSSLKISQVVACFCLKEQRERIMYGGISAQMRRYAPMSKICSAQFNSVVQIYSLGLLSKAISPYPRITVQL